MAYVNWFNEELQVTGGYFQSGGGLSLGLRTPARLDPMFRDAPH